MNKYIYILGYNLNRILTGLLILGFILHYFLSVKLSTNGHVVDKNTTNKLIKTQSKIKNVLDFNSVNIDDIDINKENDRNKRYKEKVEEFNKQNKKLHFKDVVEIDNENNEIWPPFLEPTNAKILTHLNFSRYTDQEVKFLKSYLPILIKRARRLNSVCRKYVNLMKERTHTHLLYDQTHQPNIVWCPNYKVASTTWVTNFLRLAHFNDDNPEILKMSPEDQKKYKYTVNYGGSQNAVFEFYHPPIDLRERVKVLQNSIRFTIVRHPFEKILSAYRDKMLNLRPYPLVNNFSSLQEHIIDKYRKDSNNSSPFPTFPEFIQYIIDSTKQLKTIKQWIKVKCWKPYWVQCSICSLDFNIVMKLETMVSDKQFLVIAADLKELKEFNVWRHLKNNMSSTLAANSFYNQITQKQIKNLHQRYLIDFELFDYNIDDYLLIAKDANNNTNININNNT